MATSERNVQKWFALNGHKRRGVGPLAGLFIERRALIDQQLARHLADRITLQRTRRGTFEVDAILIKTAAVAGAFELLLPFEPVRRAAQVSADGFERVDHR